jgi:hypothetical protein
MKLELANRSILNCLELASEKGEFIYTAPNQRRLGKTMALIQFAKENRYIVLVSNNSFARELQKQYGYKFIRRINSYKTIDAIGPFVFDEGCSSAHINELIRNGARIITGFMSEGPVTKTLIN